MANTPLVDTATPFLKEVAEKFPDYIMAAVKSSGWWMREEMLKGIQSNSPAGKTYIPHNAYIRSKYDGYKALSIRASLKQMYASGDAPKKYKGPDGKWKFPFPNRPDYPLSGGLRKAVTYRAYEDAWRVQTGWMSAIGTSAGLTGSYFEEGKTITVNDKMRRLFAKYGSPLSAEKKTITIPKRPSIYPVFYQHEPEVVPYIEGKLQEYIQKGGVPRSSAKKRR